MSYQSSSFYPADQEIIQHLLQDNNNRRKGEETLFNAYAYFVKEGARKYRLPEDEAFDAYSDTVLSAIEKITNGSFEGRSSLKTWLHQIFHNKCVDLLRKKTTNKSSVHQTADITDMLFQLSDSAKTVVQQLVEKADFDLLRQRLHGLGDNCRQLLQLSADGFSDREIASQMEYKSADVVKTSRLRCLDRLRQLYKRT
ncbi:MAG TPA: sigma-70 family RNA polymerase sigma factor [Chitinophagaceae bacterium]|nr:sigma-70 family RNA polymerase sigma factor [Chitinophagaceae bacterium]